MIKRIFHVLAALVLVTTSGMATAAPEGGNIVGGSGSIGKEGNKTTVTQHSERLVVDWDSFNVAKTEHVHFEQQRTTNTALNRIYDTRPSEIWGQITGKGNIWLLNPNGVIFGKTARVKTGNLVAAGMWMSKQDFMSGRYVLNNQRGTGDISNAGVLEARNIGLAGANINNSGTIKAKAGKISLASGEKMTVDFAGDRLLGFVTDKIPGKETSIENSGSIEAEEVSISIGTAKDIYGGVINTTGVIRATATDKTGGVIDLVAAEIKQNGNITADGTTGGEVTITADKKLTIKGKITARGTGGISTEQAGGSIRATAKRTELTATADIDASGETAGGEILIGGGWQGQDKSIENAKNTRVQKGATIKANANSTGDGGTIVVWSDNTTTFYGSIEATGGKEEGNGGKAEVSGKEHLLMRGTADLRATNGKAGHLLLDPGTVRICDGDASGCANAPDPPRMDDQSTMDIDESQLDTFTDAYIQTQLGMSDLTIATANAGTTNGTAEDINVESGVSIIWNANALTLTAGNDININAGSTLSGEGSLNLNAGNDLSIAGTTEGSGAAASTFWAARDVIFSGSVRAEGTGASLIQAGRDINFTSTSMVEAIGTAGSVTYGATRDINLEGTYITYGTGGVITIGALGDINVGGTFSATGAGQLWINAATDINFLGRFITTGGTGTGGFNFNNAINIGRDASLEGAFFTTGFTSTNTMDLSARNDGLNISLTAISNITPPPVEPGQMPLNPTGFDGQVTIGDGTLYFLGINTITGSSHTDTLTGINADSTWTLGTTDSYTSGTQTLMFSALENIQGGSMADTFTINGARTGDIMGGAGADVFNLTGVVTGSLSGEEDDDSFNFDTGGTVSGEVAGGTGTDVLNFGALSSQLAVSLSGRPDAGSGTVATATGFSGYISGAVTLGDSSTSTSGFSGVNRIVGSSASGDSFTGLSEAGTFEYGGSSSAPVDTYYVDAVAVGGSPYGLVLEGVESHISSGENDSYVINREYNGDLAGGTGSNFFIINAAFTGNITGGDGADFIDIAAVVTGSVDAGAGSDTLRLLPGGRISGSLALGEDIPSSSPGSGGGFDTSVDTLDTSLFNAPLTLIYDQYGGSAYVADGFYGSVTDGSPDSVIGSDGHFSGESFGIYGAEKITGAAHNPGSDSSPGTGTYLVVQPSGGQYQYDLAVSGYSSSPASSPSMSPSSSFSGFSLMLPDMMSFAGYVIMGGTDAPPFPLNDDNGARLPLSVPAPTAPISPGLGRNSPFVNQEDDDPIRVQARRTIVMGQLDISGSTSVMGSAVSLQGDLNVMTSTAASGGTAPAAVGTGELAIVATGGSPVDFEGNGDIQAVLSSGESTRSISASNALIVSRGTFRAAAATMLDLRSGTLQYAQGDEGSVSFSRGSSFVGATELSDSIEEYAVADLGLANLNVLVLTVADNPASDFIQSAAIYVDVGLLEEDLTLSSIVGKGISLYLSLCEEIEGCAPPVELADIDRLLQQGRERLDSLKQQLQSGSDAVAELVLRFEKIVRDLVVLRREFVEIFGEGNFDSWDSNIFEASTQPWEYTGLAQTGADACYRNPGWCVEGR